MQGNDHVIPNENKLNKWELN